MKREITLGFQHVLAMFTGTILIPMVLGMSVPVALFMAGVGTLLFHFVTGGKVPIFLGSSGSFIGVILIVTQNYGLEYAYGAIVISGFVYLIAALVAKLVGYQKFVKLFSPIVVGPIIMLIGITLIPIAIDMATKSWILAIVTILTVVIVRIYAKGFFKLLPIISGIVVGYIVGIFMGIVDFKPILEASWFAIPDFSTPKFNLGAISLLVPVALVTIMEHIGEVGANANVVGKNWFEKPGLHRTLLGNGITISLAGLIGAPPNTTYGENTATLAITKQFNPRIIRIAAIISILLAFLGKFAALISSIPTAVMGGISIIVFGMLITIGMQQIVSSQVDLHDMRNSAVVFITLIIGISSITKFPIVLKLSENISFSGLSLAAIVAVILNLILNVVFKNKKKE